MTPLRPLAVLALASLSADTFADRIHRLGGDPLEDVTVVSETLTTVTYTEEGDRDENEIPSDEVVRIEFTRFPAKIGEANEALRDDDPSLARDLFLQYLDESGSRPRRGYEWAPAWAAWRVVQLEGILGNPAGVVSAGTRLVENHADSRYVPHAYLAMASSLAAAGDGAGAAKKLDALDQLVARNSLSQRWTLESRLARIVASGETGDSARKKLTAIEQDAGDEFPVARNRAAVTRGELFVEEVGISSDGADSGALKKAREIFESVLEDADSDPATRAAAYAGLGSCLFLTASGSKDAEKLAAAHEAFMRVVVLHGDQTRYVPRAMFYAGRCLNFLGREGDVDRANRLYSRLMRDYPESPWAEQARNFRK